jgi:hypothetical protein
MAPERRRDPSVKRTVLGSILLFAPLLIALAILARLALRQHETIRTLRATVEDRAIALEQTGTPLNETPLPEAPAHAPTEAAAPSLPQAPAALSPAPINQQSTELNAELAQVRQNNETLQQQIRELQTPRVEPPSRNPIPEDVRTAYVGPGTWVNPEYRSPRVHKLIISGVVDHSRQSPTLTVNVGRGEVPLYLFDVNLVLSEPAYRRAFAMWEYDGSFNYLLLTFEKSGLRAEQFYLPKNPNTIRQSYNDMLKRQE